MGNTCRQRLIAPLASKGAPEYMRAVRFEECQELLAGCDSVEDILGARVAENVGDAFVRKM